MVESVGLALGHLRNAASGLLAVEDPTGEALFVFAECLDVEGLLGGLGVAPVFVPEGLSPAESLAAACELVDAAQPPVPLGVWAAVQGLRARVES